MDIFGVVIVDMWDDSSRVSSHPVFADYLVEQINLINPQAIICDSETGEETRNQNLIDRLNAPIKSHIIDKSQFMTSGLLKGNWLWVGATWQICVHMNKLGLVNLWNLRQEYPQYKDLFGMWVRPDLVLVGPHNGVTTDDYPECALTAPVLLQDYYFEWSEAEENYFTPTGKKPGCPTGNYSQTNYDMSIDRSGDKRLT